MDNQPISIKDKVFLITGAAGQIGADLAQSFLQQGAKVILADINREGLESVASEKLADCEKSQYLLYTLDICSETACLAVVEAAVNQFGRLDVLVNNAAIDAKFDEHADPTVNQSRFENYPIALLRKSVEVNLTGTIIMTQAACRQMLKQQSGNIINVASTYSVVAPNQSLYDFGEGTQNFKPVDYVASKSFIPNFTRYIATFYAKDGIRCNAIVPHGIYNNHPEAFLKNWAQLSPMGRMCNREELHGPFTFLASDASSYMTGSILKVDGGWTAW